MGNPKRAGKHQKKRFYLVTCGRDVEEPLVFSSWSKTQKRVTGFKGNQYWGFQEWAQVVAKIQQKNIRTFKVDRAIETGDTRPKEGGPVFYAVAHGRSVEVTLTYEGPGGAKALVDKHPHACHKSFRSLDEALKFNKEFELEQDDFVTIQVGSAGDDGVAEIERQLAGMGLT